MMKTQLNEKLLREYIRTIIKEDYGGFGYGGYGDFGGYGGGSGGSGARTVVVKGLVEPFLDIFKIAKGKAKELSVQAQSLGKIALGAVAQTVIPILTVDFQKIFDKQKDDIAKIRKEYEGPLKASWDAITSSDASILAFMAYPEVTVTTILFKKAPEVAKEMLDVISGGKFSDNVKELVKQEKSEKGENKKVSVSSVMPVAIPAALKTAEIIRMKDEAQVIVKKTLSDVLQKVEIVSRAKSFEELQNKLGVTFKKEVDQLKKLKPEERQQTEQKLLVAVKKSMLESYAKNLEKEVQSVLDDGFSESHPYVRNYRDVIQKIRSA